MMESSEGAEELVTRSTSMRRLLELAMRAAPTTATILITGESGTGKNRLARLIHSRSKRADGPFISIDCGALPETLLESELFGYKKGAFTGATTDKTGLFEAARGGTLFLDEIGDTPPPLQIRLLRAVQERKIRPVGATRESPVDVRLVAATNQDLERKVRSGDFREDLYFRLRVVELRVPPLRQRREDLVPLVRELIGHSCSRYSCGPCSVSPEAMDLIGAYPWPGNVRELQNALERAVVLAEHKPRIEAEDLPPEVRGGTSIEQGEILTLAEVERRHVLETLRRFDGNRRRSARALGIGETTLWRKLKQYQADQ